MKRKERQQKLHDSLINILYALSSSSSPSPPPPPPSQSSHQTKFDDETLNIAREIINSDTHHINTDELEEEKEEERSEEDGELGSQKLTRAQRKRLRKKKLKEAASHRRHIIGPQLPVDQMGGDRIDGEVSDGSEHGHEDGCMEGVRRNAAEI
ncbi:hypothetical protein M8C21_011104 [Ambrosia artemisiifolia]|uniref:Uncharacterized protein n=1 Tax=Ambrosia artemisiifolia TaxID=4212 RepID=A0AAD5DAU7_AMBAR|nr:hypothetical protein M8C21_011104 [Ambrosia artemisiifolia]